MANVDERQIDSLYQKAHTAIELVRLYNPRLLENISTIADLPSGAYGLYYSGENRKVLPPETEKALIGWGRVNRHNLDVLPKKVITQYYPHLNPAQIRSGDTIRVNVRRILKEFPDDFNRITQISSTVVHEATHEIERETTGTTSEPSAYAAERQFMHWIYANMQNLIKRFPQLAARPTITI